MTDGNTGTDTRTDTRILSIDNGYLNVVNHAISTFIYLVWITLFQPKSFNEKSLWHEEKIKSNPVQEPGPYISIRLLLLALSMVLLLSGFLYLVAFFFVTYSPSESLLQQCKVRKLRTKKHCFRFLCLTPPNTAKYRGEDSFSVEQSRIWVPSSPSAENGHCWPSSEKWLHRFNGLLFSKAFQIPRGSLLLLSGRQQTGHPPPFHEG